jgi:hypothetical protein
LLSLTKERLFATMPSPYVTSIYVLHPAFAGYNQMSTSQIEVLFDSLFVQLTQRRKKEMGFGKTEDANQKIIRDCFKSHYSNCPMPSDGGSQYKARWGLQSLPTVPSLGITKDDTDQSGAIAAFLAL